MQKRLDEMFLDHVSRDAQANRDLPIRDALETAQQKHLTAARRQFVDGESKTLQFLTGDHLPFRNSQAVDGVREIHLTVVAEDATFEPMAVARSQRDIPGDPKEERRGMLDMGTRQGRDHAQVGFLRRIGGIDGVAQHAQEEALQLQPFPAMKSIDRYSAHDSNPVGDGPPGRSTP